MLKKKLEIKNKKKTPLRQSNVNRTNIVKHIIQNKTKEITNEKQIDKPLQYYIDILKSYYNDTSELEESKIILKDLNGSVDIIGEQEFYACVKLVEFALPNNELTLENYVFKDCESLTSIAFLENTKLNEVKGSIYLTI